MKFINKDKTITHFSFDMEPSHTIDSGETVTVETHDCYGGQVYSEKVLRPDIDLSVMNPATGPIHVNGLTENDVLKIDIEDIELDERGIMITSNGMGVLGEKISEPTTRLLDVKDNMIHFTKTVRIPARPMIGVIGVAPENGERIHSAVPGNHGGNMDTKEITTGNSIYFPVFQNGGLFALGDLHASMGDGELNGTGVEIGGKNVLTVHKIADRQLKSPVVETNDAFMFIYSAETLETAIKHCSDITVTHLQETLHLDFETAYRLFSATCDIKISQIVNKLVTVRIAVPKYLLPALF